jgi:hypothetical protein
LYDNLLLCQYGKTSWVRKTSLREYKQRKRTLFLAVHVEQRLQKTLNIPNPDRLATVALQHSQWAVERARAAALLLEVDVFSSLPSVDDVTLKHSA